MSSARPRFFLGQIKASPSLVRRVPNQQILEAIERHVRGDWGIVDDGLKCRNDKAVQQPGKLVSIFDSSEGVRFAIVTEADRTKTMLGLQH